MNRADIKTMRNHYEARGVTFQRHYMNCYAHNCGMGHHLRVFTDLHELEFDPEWEGTKLAEQVNGVVIYDDVEFGTFSLWGDAIVQR
jgi:hypothetical protein